LRILIYSRAFSPATGGVESVSLTLAEQIVAAGHACTVVTETPSDPSRPGQFPFMVERRPSMRRRLALASAVDLVHSNGASLAMFPFAKLARRPFIWTHQGYQLASVDGLGWLDGRPAPLRPVPSLWLHARREGVRAGGVAMVKLGLRRAVGRLVDKNVAISRWVAMRQPLPNQVVIYNPFPLDRFKPVAARPEPPKYDFLFVGRLVSEKGVDVLLRALAVLNARPGRPPASLLIVGDGEQRPALERLADELGLGASVSFVGRKSGDELSQAIGQGAVAIVPSAYEEPMGGVALELLAAGRPIIVSERGGLAECVGDAGWTFPNGDHHALAGQMARVRDDETLRHSKDAAARAVVARFDERALAGQYLALYQQVLQEIGGGRVSSRE
jgi:glycosyltransferase involved in cell wall biosynthesis